MRTSAGITGDDWIAKRPIRPSLWAALTREGYLGALIPQAYGGSGLPLSAGAAILEEIHRSGGTAAACHAQMYTMGTLLRHGSEAQKQRYLPGVADGSLRLQAFAVTEPTSGSDTGALTTVAHKDGDRYIVSGQKIWTSRAEHADLMVLLCRTTPPNQVKKKTDGLSVFLVDMANAKNNGLEIRPIRTMMNHATTAIFFDEVPVPAANLIGGRRPWLSLHSVGNERRAHSDRRRVHR